MARIGLGQSQNAGSIAGSVADVTGAAISAVSVDAVNTATGIHTRGITGEAGFYNLPYVNSGDYILTFTRENYETFKQTGVTVHVDRVTVNAVLPVGSVATTVTVTGNVELLQHETSVLSTVLPSVSVSELPNVGRDWRYMLELIPGAVSGKNGNNDATSNAADNVAINGAQQFLSSRMVDGGSITMPISENSGSLNPPIDTISEVDIETGLFGAESGNGMSSFNVITKSGTNKFHGSLSEFVQNDVLNTSSKNWSSVAQKKPVVRWNMYGGTLGGPILHDKLFFFFGYFSNPNMSYTHNLYTFPTVAMRNGDFSDPTFAQIYNPATTTKTANGYTRTPFLNNKITTPIDPVAAKIQAFFPVPNAVNPAHPEYNNYYFSAVNPSHMKDYIYKISGQTNPNNLIVLSGLVNSNGGGNATPDNPIDAYLNNGLDQTNQLTDVFTISTTKVNEFRMGVVRSKGLWTPDASGKGYPAQLGLNLPANTFPVINVSNGPGLSIGGGAIQAVLAETGVQAADTFNWIVGKHSIKVGGEYDIWTDNLGWGDLNAGSFNFTGIDTRDPNPADANASSGVGYADFLLGGTASWNVQIGEENGGKEANLQLFAQDYYKARPNLTINYGFRFVRQGGWTEEHNRIANYVPTLMNPVTHTLGAAGFAGVQIPAAIQATTSFIAPRIGFAYSPKEFTAVRGGFGIFPIPWSGNGYLSGTGNGWTIQGALQPNFDNVTPVFQLAGGPPAPLVPTAATRTPSLLNGQSIGYMPYHTPVSYYEQWQFDVQQQFGNASVQVAYVGTRGLKLPFLTDINQVTVGHLGSGIRPNPTYQTIGATEYTSYSNYNALQLTAKQKFSDGLNFALYYTYGKTLDTGTGEGGNGWNLDSYQNAYSPAANYAASSDDIRQTLSGNMVYELPFGKGRKFANHNEFADFLIGGWQESTVLQFRSGEAFTPLMANNLSGALAGNWFPNRSGSIKVSHPSVNEWYNTSAFTSPAANTFGNSSRNILYGPHFYDVDVSIAKSFPISVFDWASSFQFKADISDVLNHPNYGLPNANIGSSGAGTISSSLTNRGIQLGGIYRF